MAGGHEEFERLQNEFFRLTFDTDWEEASCLFNKDHKSVELFEKNKARFSRCECGFVYSSKQPTQALLDKFYTKSKPMTSWANHKTTNQQEIKQGIKFSRLVTELCGRDIKSLCDIGCGTGKFLSLLPDSIEKYGTDPNGDSLSVAKGANPDATFYLDEDYMHDERQFDCITLTGVLEHVKDPEGLVRSCYSRLNPGGYLAVIVPTSDSFLIHTIWDKASAFCPQHLWFFNQQTLGRLMNRAGFKEDLAYTVETEAGPIAKYKLGFHPYRKGLTGVFKQEVEKLAANVHELVKSADNGYKIVGIYRRD